MATPAATALVSISSLKFLDGMNGRERGSRARIGCALLVDSIEGAEPGNWSPLVKLSTAPAARLLIVISALSTLDGMNGRDGFVDSIEGAVPGNLSPLVKLSTAPAARALVIVISLALLNGMDDRDGLVDTIEGVLPGNWSPLVVALVKL